MIDAHAHLTDQRLHGSVGALLERARGAGVEHLLMAGTEPLDWDRQRELAATHPGLSMVFGLHPWWAKDARAVRDGLDRLEEALSQGFAPVAIGETGLDRSPRHKDTLEHQKVSLLGHLRIALDRDLPVVLHVVRSHGLMLECLRSLEEVPRGMVHAFDGSLEVAREYQALGLHLSVGGRVCAPSARRLQRAVVAIRSERLLIETDAPDQLPHGLNGELNEPANLVRVAERLAELRGTTLDDIANVTASNARRLFRLPD